MQFPEGLEDSPFTMYNNSHNIWIINYPNSFKTHRRFGRSIEDEEIIDEHEALSNAILDASLNDAEDCAKKLICSLNAKELSTLASDESAIAELFGKSGSIDVSGIFSKKFDLEVQIFWEGHKI